MLKPRVVVVSGEMKDIFRDSDGNEVVLVSIGRPCFRLVTDFLEETAGVVKTGLTIDAVEIFIYFPKEIDEKWSKRWKHPEMSIVYGHRYISLRQDL